MHRASFFLLPIIVSFIVIVGLSLVIEQPPSSPYFLRFTKTVPEDRLSSGQIYQIILRQLDLISDKGNLFGVFFHGSRDKKNVALTFDADMTSGMISMLKSGKVKSFYDDRLISFLNSSKTPATLFLTGLWVESYPAKTEELAKNPLFELGSHSYAHKAFVSSCYNLEQIANEQKVEDIGASQLLLEKYTSKKVNLFRFPGGCFGPDDISLLKLAGLSAIEWDVVADDGFNNNKDQIIQKVVSQVKNGSVIVMHMNGYPNEPVDYEAVPEIVSILKSKGYSFVTVSQLMDSYHLSFNTGAN